MRAAWLLLPAVVLAPPCRAFLFWGDAQRARIKAEIRAVEQDPAYYSAVAVARVHRGDAGAAFDAARQEAFQRLAEQVRVTVAGVLRSELRIEQGGGRARKSARIERFVETKTRAVLADPESGLYPALVRYEDHPKKGRLTVLVSLRKGPVRARLERETRLKRERVRAFAGEAAAALAAGGAAQALGRLLDAQRAARDDFPELPFPLSVGEGPEVEAHGWIDAKLGALLGSLRLEFDAPRVDFDSRGLPRRAPVLRALRAEPGKEAVPVPGLSLAFEFSSGEGRLGAERAVTDAQGRAAVPVEWVRPDGGQALLRGRLDPALFAGLAAEQGRWWLPEASVPLGKIRTAALAVEFRVDGRAAPPGEWEADARRLLAARGFAVQELGAPAGAPLAESLRRAAEANADFLLLVAVRASARKEGGYELYGAVADSELAFYRLPGGEPVFMEEGPRAEAAAAAPAEAAAAALSRLRPALRAALAARLEGAG